MWNEPTNKEWRKAYYALTTAARVRVKELAAQLYDGTRTVAACWREAIETVTHQEENC